MSLAGLMGADHAFYYERARVLLPFRTGARTYLGETAFRYWCKPFSSPLATDQRRIPAADWNAGLEVRSEERRVGKEGRSRWSTWEEKGRMEVRVCEEA